MELINHDLNPVWFTIKQSFLKVNINQAETKACFTMTYRKNHIPLSEKLLDLSDDRAETAQNFN